MHVQRYMMKQVCAVQNVTTFFTFFVLFGFVVKGEIASASALTPELTVGRAA